MKIGTCHLCLRENQELQNSYFISAGIYQVCKDGTKQPIMVGGGSSRHTGGQIADELYERCIVPYGSYHNFYAHRKKLVLPRYATVVVLTPINKISKLRCGIVPIRYSWQKKIATGCGQNPV
jgi:hypothetical protein